MFRSHARQQRLAHTLNWVIVEDDDAWTAALQQPLAAVARPKPRASRRQRLLMLFSLLVLLALGTGTGLWGRRQAQAGYDQVEQTMADTVKADLWLGGQEESPPVSSQLSRQADKRWRAALARECDVLRAQQMDLQTLEQAAQVTLLDLGKDWALVQMVTRPAPDQPLYRQLRVYRETEQGWLRTAPAAQQWGAEHQLESRYFVFVYRTRDHEAVSQAAPRLDDLYVFLYATFFGEAPPAAKIVIHVTPEQPPGVITRRAGPDAPLVTAAPGVYLAPATFSDADLLAQAVFLSLLDEVTEEATSRYDLPEQWAPMVDAVRLWALWQTDLPLATWRTPLTTWVMVWPQEDAVGARSRFSFGAALCNQHTLWMLSPLDLEIPILCLVAPRGFWEYGWNYRTTPHLGWLPPMAEAQNMRDPAIEHSLYYENEWVGGNPARTVALASVVEYAMATYGADRLHAWLASLPRHDGWETLVPKFFGVSTEEFESGWRAYLAAHYTVGDDAANGSVARNPAR